MNREQVVQGEFVHRFVNQSLSEQEREAFEHYLLEDPETLEEVELALMMKVGLSDAAGDSPAAPSIEATTASAPARAGLRSGADPEPTSQRPPRTSNRGPVLATAAALLAVTLLPALLSSNKPSPYAAASVEANVAVITFTQTRSFSTNTRPESVVLPMQAPVLVLEVQLDDPQYTQYTMAIVAIAEETRLEVTDLIPMGQGDLRVSVPSQLLPSGEYELVVSESQTGRNAETARFRLRLSR